VIIHGSDDAPTTIPRPTYPPAPVQSNEEGVPPLVHVPPQWVADEQSEEEAYAALNPSFTVETAQDNSQDGSAPFFGGKAPRKSSTALYNTGEAYAAYGADKSGSAPFFGTTGSPEGKAPHKSDPTQNMEAYATLGYGNQYAARISRQSEGEESNEGKMCKRIRGRMSHQHHDDKMMAYATQAGLH
jgi:hypothetical protein